MPKLTICRGIPASGKSTVTRQRTAASNGTLKRICKDDLRLMMDTTSKFGLTHMRQYNELIKDMWYRLLWQGFDVILDETFIRRSDIERVLTEYEDCSIFYSFEPEFEIIDLTTVPFEECVLRDKARHPSLGYNVLLEYKEDLEREGDTCTIMASLPESFGHFISVTTTLSEQPLLTATV